MHSTIEIRNARLHNLKNVNLDIPKNKIVVITGLSGSGKSTIAMDILLKEGQRQYMESLGMITFGRTRPPVDSIVGLSPTISVDQYLLNHSPRSTVGTVTDIFTYLRVLYARIGHRNCPHCGMEVPPMGFESQAYDWQDESDESADETFPCPGCGRELPELSMAHFSFNKPEGACTTCTGLSVVRQAIVSRLIDENRSIPENAVYGWTDFHNNRNGQILQAAGRYYGFTFDITKPVKDYTPVERDLLLYGTDSPQFKRHFPGIKPPSTSAKGRFEGVITTLMRRYDEHASDAAYREKLDDLFTTQTCTDCEGTRLRPESRAVTVAGLSIDAVSRLSLKDLDAWLQSLPQQLTDQEMLFARPILDDLQERIRRLIEVGVGYLTLERSTPTISAGEARRLRLAALLGSGLTGMLYVLDEPTIGLHQRDTGRLISVLRRLRDLGNTVLVVEHDLELIKAADYLIDIGPGAGKYGGQIVAAGTPAEVAQTEGSLTGAFIAGTMTVPVPETRRKRGQSALMIKGARHFNLNNLTIEIPLGLLVAVTGVSGSGKSSLIFKILATAAHQRLNGTSEKPGDHDSITGWEYIDKVITIDQSQILRIPRSNAATYSDAFTPIREAFAATPDGKKNKATARQFSFNVPGGRCERCQGAGTLAVKMHFLPEVEVRCPACRGRRFKRETLAIKYRGYDISQVLEMTVEEALELFSDVPAIASRLQFMSDVGLGYLKLGQPATTLSGGEAQRLKLARELGRSSTGRTLYLLDEPTTGLHPADTARLLQVLQRLVDAGNSLIVIEHNLDLVKAADWVIDLGPEGGAEGGRLVAEGTPGEVAEVEESYTGQYLKTRLQQK
ncbi:excinuclease ABC subunit UvrA [Methanocella arvoryzae]|uniref:Excinuclease ABC, ATPase subunit n=1 Tax=Methanocella arvoryzae (strain DSM 22066 / NBRC 105507 / MRE50) TaxID=351160 RepID=Q0W0L7_METAR|nr:excinuclease ABC subunit UvrA [Methanocella arvoryzae]CAJ38076.1 excinuclease ABC, ATPase subunit [Methanocella arvoryzae MRE50]